METKFDDVSKLLHESASDKGFYENLNFESFNGQAKQLAMIHSEVTEVLEALRKGQGEHKVVEELADILIRVFDFYGAALAYGVIDPEHSLDEIFKGKVNINKSRPKMHGVLG